MTTTRIFLLIEGLIWLPYGVLCFLRPGVLAEVAGVTATTATAVTEVRAMYGGLQMGIGVLALAGLGSAALARSALLMLAIVTGGLALARLGGLALDGGVSGYTVGGLVFELGSAAAAIALLRRG